MELSRQTPRTASSLDLFTSLSFRFISLEYSIVRHKYTYWPDHCPIRRINKIIWRLVGSFFFLSHHLFFRFQSDVGEISRLSNQFPYQRRTFLSISVNIFPKVGWGWGVSFDGLQERIYLLTPLTHHHTSPDFSGPQSSLLDVEDQVRGIADY